MIAYHSDFDGQPWEVEIIDHRDGHVFQLAASPIIINLDAISDEIIPYAYSKTLLLRLISSEILEHIALAELTNEVVVKRDGVIQFAGQLVPYDYSEPITSTDYVVEIKAVCKLTNMLLDKLPYSDNTEAFTPTLPFLDTALFDVFSVPNGDIELTPLNLSAIEIRPRWLKGFTYQDYFKAVANLFGGVWYERQGRIAFQFLNQSDYGLLITEMLQGASLATEVNTKTLEVTYTRAREHRLFATTVAYANISNSNPSKVINSSSLAYINTDLVLDYNPGKLFIVPGNNPTWEVPFATEQLIEADIDKVNNPYWDGISAFDPRGYVVQIIIQATDDTATNHFFNGSAWQSSSIILLRFIDEPFSIDLPRLPDYNGEVVFLVSFEFFPLQFFGETPAGFYYGFAYTCEGGRITLKGGETIESTEEIQISENGKGSRTLEVSFNNYDADGSGKNIRVSNNLIVTKSLPLLFDTYGRTRQLENNKNSIRFIDADFYLPENFYFSNWPADTMRYDYGAGIKAFRLQRAAINVEIGIMTGCRLREVFAVDAPAPPAEGLAAPVMLDETQVGTGGWQANWQAVAGATEYQIQLADDAAFSNILVDLHLPGTAYVFQFLQCKDYWYRVRAKNATETSDWANNLLNNYEDSVHFRGADNQRAYEFTRKITNIQVLNAFSWAANIKYKWANATGVTDWGLYLYVADLAALQSAVDGASGPYSILIEVDGYATDMSEAVLILKYQDTPMRPVCPVPYTISTLSRDILIAFNSRVQLDVVAVNNQALRFEYISVADEDLTIYNDTLAAVNSSLEFGPNAIHVVGIAVQFDNLGFETIEVTAIPL